MQQTLPLSGIRVVELGGNISGPYGTWILGQLGATVSKIERPEGDDARGWGPPFWEDTATVFQAINTNKASVAVDLKDEAQLARLRDYIATHADVVLQNMRPGSVAKLGLDAEAMCAANPRLIYCNLWAYGRTGPLSQRPGYDALMQAFGGVMSITGEEGRPPVRAGISAIDMGTGMWCAIGILAALNRRHQTGRGGIVDASLFETAIAWTSFYNLDAQVVGEDPAKHGSGVRGITPYQGYECADGYLIVAASNDRLFVKLADMLGHPEWCQDPRFADNAARSRNKPELNAILEPIFRKETREHWRALLDEAGIPNAPIQVPREVVAHPQTQALGILQDTGRTLPDGQPVAMTGLPLSFDGERPPLRSIPPALGSGSLPDGETGDA